MSRTQSVLDPLPRIIRQIPAECFRVDRGRAFGTLVRDYALALGIGALIIVADTWWIGLPLAMVLGTVLTGLFVIGHDAGHGSFSSRQQENRLVGHLTLPWLLWPFDVWRISHDIHHRWTHHAEKDIAWNPMTYRAFRKLPSWQKFFYVKSRSSMFFWASLLFQFYMVTYSITGQMFEAKDRRRLLGSTIWMALVASFYIGGSIWLGGAYGLICLFVAPQLAFHFWLSVFTLLHHTNKKNRLLADEEWSPARAQLACSVNVRYPGPVDWFTHDIGWHIPHHVCVGIPHYHLRQAHGALAKAYPEIVQDYKLSWSYVKEIISTCHLVESRTKDGLEWIQADFKPPVPAQGGVAKQGEPKEAGA